MTPTLTFVCSICGEPSVSICVYCTKDACPNHVCERCGRCSDCCECDVRLEEQHEQAVAPEIHPLPGELDTLDEADLLPAPPDLIAEPVEPVEPVAIEPETVPAEEAAPLSAEQWVAPEDPVAAAEPEEQSPEPGDKPGL